MNSLLNCLLNIYRVLTILKNPLLLRGLAGALLALFVQCSVALDAGKMLSSRYPPGSIATVEVAEAALEQTASENARIERQYVQDEQACTGVFFVSACRDKAKEHRRAALEPVRLVQIEAETVVRRMQVADRDQALMDRRLEKAAEAVQAEQNAQKKAQAIAEKQERQVEKDRERPLNEQRHAQDDGGRSSDRQARQTRMKTEVVDDAQKRAANVAAYEKKLRKAQAHQRDIAAKKAEKNRNRMVRAPAEASAGESEVLPLSANPVLAIPKP